MEGQVCLQAAAATRQVYLNGISIHDLTDHWKDVDKSEWPKVLTGEAEQYLKQLRNDFFQNWLVVASLIWACQSTGIAATVQNFNVNSHVLNHNLFGAKFLEGTLNRLIRLEPNNTCIL